MNYLTYSLYKKCLKLIKKGIPSINPDKATYRLIDKEFGFLNEKYQKLSFYKITKDTLPEDTSRLPIFVSWWQGYERAPLLVEKCIDSIKNHSKVHPVLIITQDNWKEYLDLPEYILEKVKNKEITLTHLSDILRMGLLNKHGGMWLDATIYVARDIPEEYFNMPLFTIKYPKSKSRITKGRWTGYCLASMKRNNPLMSYCFEIFLEYWKQHNKLFEYLFIDYVIAYAYDKIPIIRTLIDSVPENNIGVQDLVIALNDPYDPDEYQRLLESSIFFKLKWQKEYELTVNGKDTVYKHFITSR